MQKLFPTPLIILGVCAVAARMPSGDWCKVVYWPPAATQMAVVTW